MRSDGEPIYLAQPILSWRFRCIASKVSTLGGRREGCPSSKFCDLVWQAKCSDGICRGTWYWLVRAESVMGQFANAIPMTNEVVLDPGKPLPGCVSVLPIRDAVLFPFSMVPLTVGRSGSLKLLEDLRLCSSDRLIGVLSQRDASKDDPGADELFSVGTNHQGAPAQRRNPHPLRAGFEAVSDYPLSAAPALSKGRGGIFVGSSSITGDRERHCSREAKDRNAL